MLQRDKLPVFLTMLFFLCAWSVTKIVDNLLKSSVVEYRVEQKHHTADSSDVYYTINNLSDHLLKDITFRLAYFTPKDGSIHNAEIITIAPAFKEDISTERDEVNNEYANYKIPQLQPEWKYVLGVSVKGSKLPVFSFVSRGDETINLKEAGFITWLIKSQNTIILSLLSLWIGCIIIYLLYLKDQQTKP